MTINQLLDGLIVEYETSSEDGVSRKLSLPMKSHLKCLREFFGVMRAMTVHKCHVQAFIDKLKAEGKKNATINRPLQMLSQAYKIAVTSYPPVLSRLLRVPRLNEKNNIRKGKFTNAEAEMIFVGLPAHMTCVARFAYETGARAGEILKLKWGYLGQDAIVVPASDTKNRKELNIALTPQLKEIIEVRRAARVPGCDLIFHNKGRAIRDYRKCWQTVCVLSGLGRFYCRDCRDEKHEYISVLDAKKACPKCGRKCRAPKYVGRIFHDFRRSAAHELWKAGNSVQDCMEVTGHATESMFKRYADLFSKEEKLARQREVQQNRQTWREAQTKTTADVPPSPTPARGLVQ